MITPDYYGKFCCIGSECKNNCCCGGWDIEVDSDALKRFGAIGGEFGKRVRASVGDDNVFIRKGGKCSLLNADGLCDMVLNGEKLCVICDEYPRFTEYYGDYIERGISVSCEAAARIVLDSPCTVRLVGESGSCAEDIFRLLYDARGVIFDILSDTSVDVSKAIRLVLDYGEKLQIRINENDYSEFAYTPVDRTSDVEVCDEVFNVLYELEYLSDDWCGMLHHHKTYTAEYKARELALYFVYRYFLKAVFDCDALSKLRLMAVSVIAITAMADVCGDVYESARRYSVEVEHNEDNIEMIYDEFLFNDGLSTEKIIGMIK